MPADRAEARTRHPRHQRRGEARLPAAVATLVAIALYLALPEQLLVAPRFVVPALEILLLVPLVAINPRRVTRQTRISRVLSLSLVVVIGVTNLGALALLIHDLVAGAAGDGQALLLGALQVWLANLIAFGPAYWELDRGGPVKRPSPAAPISRWPISGSPRTRTPTPSRRSPKGPASRPTGYRRWWTTCTCR
ncbi:hypothetical protein MUY14_16925 [Amycolatopsis sp. FBCC-B4732]|uniref:hypothetical protein n=1 Tax=Amycolatopsis sp. FBCC-B4732 TaxID=3079339 RepID=UPI001FF13297|nr:hypothetical protein [Amycolatopsis sp. FBCC-B4732]UOX92220.1 hypothetical protein MUY14_16925 [Amycolatopsis sp. FBCC-B4732]